MAATSLGFRLNIDTQSKGVGFVNPYPLPDFASGLTRLHLLRRSPHFASYNRVTQQAGDLVDMGASFEAEQIWADTISTRWGFERANLDFDTGFTVAMALNLRGNPQMGSETRIALLRTDDTSVNEQRGFYVNLIESSNYDFGFNTRIYTGAGTAVVNAATDLPTGGEDVLVFVAWDGAALTASVPNGTTYTSDLEPGDTTKAPLPDAGMDFANTTSGTGDPETAVNIGFSAYAQWDRALSQQEIVEEHAKMVAWAAPLGLDLV